MERGYGRREIYEDDIETNEEERMGRRKWEGYKRGNEIEIRRSVKKRHRMKQRGAEKQNMPRRETKKEDKPK
jgi:hypothetical protein